MKSYLLFPLAVTLCLFTAPITKPVSAQGYEGLVQPQSNYNYSRSGQSTGGGYDGLVGWESQRSSTNPYGTAPAGDIYQFVRGSGSTMEERREIQKQAREEQRRARQQQMMDTNRQRAEALNAKLKEENQERQRAITEQHAQILQRMQQQQQQQQQRR